MTEIHEQHKVINIAQTEFEGSNAHFFKLKAINNIEITKNILLLVTTIWNKACLLLIGDRLGSCITVH